MSNSKKLLCMLLSLIMVFSVFTVAAVPAGAYNSDGDYSKLSHNGYDPYDSYTVDAKTPYSEEAIVACGGDLSETQTIYFQAPADWANKYNTFEGPDDSEPYMHVCAYWWSGIAGSSDKGWPSGKGSVWVGYQAHLLDKANRIYAIKMPNDGGSPTVVWNNGVNGGMDESAAIFQYGRQILDANTEGAVEGDYETLPEGSPTEDDFDGCIQIIDYNVKRPNPLTGFDIYGYNWYVYYGGGCYGSYATDSDNFTSVEDNCLNPEHYVNGIHVAEVLPATTDEPQKPTEHNVSGDGVIYFDAASAGWSGVSWISFYIYGLGGEGNITEWGSKNKLYTSNCGSDIFAFNAKEAGVQDGHEYGVIFMNFDTRAQTADLLFNSSCFGDTAYVPNPDDMIENAVDFNKKSMKAAWKNSSLGTIKQITSLGNIVGDSIPSTTSAYQMMVNFLASKDNQSLTYALGFNGKDAQTTIDDIAKELGLSKDDVEKAIYEAAEIGSNDGYGDKTDWSHKWDKSKSTLEDGSGGGSSGGSGGDVPYYGDGMIYFDAASAGWSGVRWVSFYIYGLNGEGNITEWGSKNKAYTSNYGDIWAFNAYEAGVQYGHEYGIIFENLDTTAQTTDLLFNYTCFGDTAYVPNPGNKIENAVDSNKASMIARWKNSTLGPIKQITSIGNVIGESIPANTSAYQMFVNFLASKGSQSLTNAQYYNPRKDIQTIIDDTAKALGLDKDDVEKAIKEAKDTGTNDGSGDKTDWSSKWDKSKSTLPGGALAEDLYGYVLKDYYLTGSINGDNSGLNAVHKELRFEDNGTGDMLLSGVKLKAGDKVKVALYNGGKAFTLYPDGVGREVVIDKSGVYDFYFKPYEMGNPNYWYITPTYVGEAKAGVKVSGKIRSYLSDTDPISVLLMQDGKVKKNVNVKGNSAEYSFDDVEAGTYSMLVTKKNHVNREYTVTVADKDISQDVKLCPKGDVNGDGETDIMDCSVAQRYIRELTTLDAYQIACGDVSGTGDGELDIQDVSRILRHIRELAMLY